MKNLVLLLAIAGLYMSCTHETQQNKIILGEDIARHIAVLSSDDFQGRMPFTEGETKTINYIKDQFEAAGLLPGNGDSYFQEVPMVELEAINISPMVIKANDKEIDFAFKSDFVALTRRVTEHIEITNSEMVFAGFGIVAPEYDWNDYKGLDVAGKTVIVLVNDPGFDTGDDSFFKGDAMTYYGRWTYKYEEAARQGATAILIVHDTEPAAYPWAVVENGWTGANLYLNAEDENMSRCKAEGWITTETAKAIFVAANRPDYDFTSAAQKRDFESFSVDMKLSISFDNTINRSSSQNVAGLITGTQAPEDIIIYSGHWDHLGIGFQVDGDSIYNGAIDNASGIAAIIEIASRFADSENPPKRSVLFLAVTAEEQGLLGSAYYAENPIFPPANTVANLNIDALNALGEMKDLTVVGYGQSEMDELAQEAATKQGRYILPDQHPSKGYFFRSDHFNFAKVGIPALYASGSHEHFTKGVEWTEAQNAAFVAKNYHQPSDEMQDNWDLSGFVQDAELLYDIGNKLAQDPELWPKWKEGSEFKAAREQ